MPHVPGTPHLISSADEAAELGRRIRSAQRPEPFVVITTAQDQRLPWFDAEAVAARLKFKAEVWIVPQRWTWDVNTELDPDARVHGGAAIVHPPEGVPPHRTLRFLATSQAEADGLLDELVDTALTHTTGGARRAARPATVTKPAPAQDSSPATGGIRRLTTVDEVNALADRLLDPGRDIPICVVTVPAQREASYIDAAEIAAIGPEAEVYLLATGSLTFALSRRLNPMAGVYGGAGRVYPPGQHWLQDPYTSALRFAYNAGEGRRATDALLNDLLSGLVRSGRVGSQTPARPPQRAHGAVAGVLPPSRALVRLRDGQMATIWAELVDPDLTIDALVSKGMEVSGLVDHESRRIDIAEMVRPWHEAIPGVTQGVVVLAQVGIVMESTVTLIPYPGISVAVATDEVTGNPLDDLRELFSPGEVVAARVADLPGEASSGWKLSLLDVDDNEPRHVAAILAGGPPWLAEPVATDDVPESLHDVEESPDDARLAEEHRAAADRLSEIQGRAEVDVATRRVAELEEALVSRELQISAMSTQLRSMEHQVTRLRAQVEHQRTVARRAQSKARKSRGAGPPERELHGFVHPEDQLRWEIERAWVETTRPEEKELWPLREYRVGSEFCGSLAEVEGVSREKVLAIALLILTGRGVKADHENRTNEAGNAPPVTRVEDGQTWVCRRAPLQVNSPSARRLSYWRGSDGSIELSRITLHDDYTP